MSWGAVITVGGGLLSGFLNNKSKKKQEQQQQLNNPQTSPEAIKPEYYDPYAKYRPEAANKLNGLMNNPMEVEKLPSYAAMYQAAQRASASQGYNGSGNALVAAANAGGAAYQQEFNNLAMLSGANSSPGQAAYMAAQQGNANRTGNQYDRTQQDINNNNTWGNIGNAVGRINWGNIGGNNGGTDNWNSNTGATSGGWDGVGGFFGD